MKTYSVHTSWKNAWAAPVLLRAGDPIKIHLAKTEENPAWKGWIWCSSDNQQCWIPEQIVKINRTEGNFAYAIVTQSYSSLELDVMPGQVVEGDQILNGWLWCRIITTNTFGWVPMHCLGE